MKPMKKTFSVLVVAVMLIALLPTMQTDAVDTSNPILVLSATTAVNPVLDHVLDFSTFSKGGPHTVTFQWKAVNIRENDASDPDAGYAVVGVTGTVYGTNQSQSVALDPPKIYGNTDWQSVSFTFQNVGYPMTSSGLPDSILRFVMWKAEGELHIKNVVIKNAAGTVLYNLNTDPVVEQAISNMQENEMWKCDISEFMDIYYENCTWATGQFSSGDYSAYLTYEDAPQNPTTVPTTTVTTQATTKPTTAPTTSKITTASTTKPSTAISTTASTVESSVSTTVPASTTMIDPCANGHDLNEFGCCKNCLYSRPSMITIGVETTVNSIDGITTDTSIQQDASSDSVESDNTWVWLSVICVLAVALLGATVCIVVILRRRK